MQIFSDNKKICEFDIKNKDWKIKIDDKDYHKFYIIYNLTNNLLLEIQTYFKGGIKQANIIMAIENIQDDFEFNLFINGFKRNSLKVIPSEQEIFDVSSIKNLVYFNVVCKIL